MNPNRFPSMISAQTFSAYPRPQQHLQGGTRTRSRPNPPRSLLRQQTLSHPYPPHHHWQQSHPKNQPKNKKARQRQRQRQKRTQPSPPPSQIKSASPPLHQLKNNQQPQPRPNPGPLNPPSKPHTPSTTSTPNTKPSPSPRRPQSLNRYKSSRSKTNLPPPHPLLGRTQTQKGTRLSPRSISRFSAFRRGWNITRNKCYGTSSRGRRCFILRRMRWGGCLLVRG